MYKHLLIKKITAVFLLFVFTLGITPKKNLHSWVANHKDSTAKSSDGKTQQIGKAGFNCKCDNLVAESNFLSAEPFVVTKALIYSSFNFYNKSSFHSLSVFFIDLRGPPINFQS